MDLELLKKIMPGRKVKIVKLCNYEEHYKPGDVGVIEYVDDEASLHTNWENGGSIALLTEDEYDTWMPKEKVLKQVKENFKKKRAVWSFGIASFCTVGDAYDFGLEVHKYLESSFTNDEKEKFGFNKLRVSITPSKYYDVTIDYRK